MNKACISINATIPTSENTFEFVETSKQSFDFPAPLISTQSAAILSDRPFAVAFVWSEGLRQVVQIGGFTSRKRGACHYDADLH